MPEKMRTYEEVKERVANDYSQRKQQIALQDLMKEIMSSSEVKVYAENID